MENPLVNPSSLSNTLMRCGTTRLLCFLIYNGKPTCESLIIVQYVDEVWNDKSPLLPSDPYERSQARYWADFVDKKIYGKGLWRKARGRNKRFHRKLEDCLNESLERSRIYVGGESFGFVDVALIPISSWFYAFETSWNFRTEVEYLKISAWIKRRLQRESVSKPLPDPHKIYGYFLQLK